MRMLETFALRVNALGGRSLLVGGAVLDRLAAREVKDWDIEVHGVPMSQLTSLLGAMGLPINEVGKAFGVIKTTMDGVEVDLSLPRRDSKSGNGHKGFTIEVDPSLGMVDAFRRRDLTINAMGTDLLTNELVDPFGGMGDFHTGVLRHVDDATFVEDPLRVLRIMQLLPRKGRVVHPHTIERARSIVGDFRSLPRERVLVEFEKLLLKADKPSMGLRFLVDCGWISCFPELGALIGCPQNPVWHPEGDVWEHTLMVVDAAAEVRHNVAEEQRLAFMLGALLHDCGKPLTTTEDLRSPGHAEAGIDVAKMFLARLTNNTSLIESVCMLVEHHMKPPQMAAAEAKDGAWRRLRTKADLTLLGWLTTADKAGRLGASVQDTNKGADLCFHFASESVEVITPLVTGKDLIAVGMKPGPTFKLVLGKAFEMQMDGMSRNAILEAVL